MLIEGDGYFEMPDGSDIGEGMEMEESNGLLGQIIDRNQILKYVPTSVGTHKIKVGVYSKSGFEHSEILTYEVSYSPFTFIYATASATYPLNVKKPTKVTFLRDNTPNYQFQYLVTGGSGTLYNGTAALAQATDFRVCQRHNYFRLFTNNFGRAYHNG
jgi:hypothetical protein